MEATPSVDDKPSVVNISRSSHFNCTVVLRCKFASRSGCFGNLLVCDCPGPHQEANVYAGVDTR